MAQYLFQEQLRVIEKLTSAPAFLVFTRSDAFRIVKSTSTNFKFLYLSLIYNCGASRWLSATESAHKTAIKSAASHKPYIAFGQGDQIGRIFAQWVIVFFG
jgi:hypothetical protein